MRRKFENRRIYQFDCSNFTFLLIIIYPILYKLILTYPSANSSKRKSPTYPRKNTRFDEPTTDGQNTSVPFVRNPTIRYSFDTHKEHGVIAGVKRSVERARFLHQERSIWIHTHTHTHLRPDTTKLPEEGIGAALRASNLLNLLLFGQVTRHREVVEYILIFHFLWIYSAYRVLPRCLANDDDVPSSFFLDDSSRTGPTGQRLHESVIHNLGVRAIWITATVKKGKGKVSPKSFLRRD